MCLVNMCVLANAISRQTMLRACTTDMKPWWDCRISWLFSCSFFLSSVREWITYRAATRVQHNKGSIFNTCHQNSIKCNFIYSNIQFPENKKVYKATASLEWDSGLARVLYTLRPVGGIHKVPDLLQVLSMGLVALHNTGKDTDCRYNKNSLPSLLLGKDMRGMMSSS